MGVRSHHLVLRLGVDAHHARVTVGDLLAIRVFGENGFHILIFVVARSKSKSSLFTKSTIAKKSITHC
jgi:hypothetical protein